ncbi:MAG: hypothetical protein IKV96_01520 [Firmicutes bacterium]|nr:hypothetical protein [Bacillota bacterium]
MKKLGVKTSRYANTELYTLNPINEAGEGTIKLSGLKYGFERGFQFYKLDVPKPWMNPTGEFEKQVKPMCTPENRLTDWETIEAYFLTCVEE